MNRDRFRSMQEQLVPSPGAQAALKEALASNHRRPLRWKPYAAVAACAALVLVAAIPLVRSLRGPQAPALHSYTMTDGQVIAEAQESAHVQAPAGTAQEESATTEASGQTGTGEELSVQAGAALYDRLMASFPTDPDTGERDFPAWYGGSFLREDGGYTVILVEERDTPALREEIAGIVCPEEDEESLLSFQTGRYALSFLHEQLERLQESEPISSVLAAAIVLEMENRIEVTLTEPSEDALAELARLDPNDDVFTVLVGQRPSTEEELPVSTDSFTVSHEAEPFPEENGIQDLPSKLPDIQQKSGATSNTTPAVPPTGVTVQARVLKVTGNTMLVEVTVDGAGLHAEDQATFSWPEAASFSPDDPVSISFSGDIMETWPCQLGNVYSVARADG